MKLVEVPGSEGLLSSRNKLLGSFKAVSSATQLVSGIS